MVDLLELESIDLLSVGMIKHCLGLSFLDVMRQMTTATLRKEKTYLEVAYSSEV